MKHVSKLCPELGEGGAAAAQDEALQELIFGQLLGSVYSLK